MYVLCLQYNLFYVKIHAISQQFDTWVVWCIKANSALWNECGAARRGWMPISPGEKERRFSYSLFVLTMVIEITLRRWKLKKSSAVFQNLYL